MFEKECEVKFFVPKGLNMTIFQTPYSSQLVAISQQPTAKLKGDKGYGKNTDQNIGC